MLHSFSFCGPPPEADWNGTMIYNYFQYYLRICRPEEVFLPGGLFSPFELLFQLGAGQLDGYRAAVGTVFYLTAHHRTGHLLQLLRAVLLAPLDGRLAGHGVHYPIPGGIRIGPAGGKELPGQFGEGGLHIPRIHIVGALAHDDRSAAEVLGLKTKARQQGKVLKQDGPLLRRRGEHHRRQEHLAHGRIALRLQAVEVHPLVGGMLIDE